MIEITCDDCERRFAVEDEQAGEKVPCPYCGDINRVPAAIAAAAALGAAAAGAASPEPAPEPAPSAAAAGGTRSLPSAGGPEREIQVVRPAMFRAHPFRYLLIVTLFLAGVVLGWTALAETLPRPFVYPGLAIVAAAVLWWVSWWFAAHIWIKVVITNKRTIRHEGIVRRHSTEVLHDHVRSVDIQQDFLDRIFRVGYIGIDSSGQDGIEIEIRDIPGPFRIKKLIDQYRVM